MACLDPQGCLVPPERTDTWVTLARLVPQDSVVLKVSLVPPEPPDWLVPRALQAELELTGSKVSPERGDPLE